MKSTTPHITIFGSRNSGKSTLINALTNQALAITSPVPGTTADPVSKAMELLPIGSVVLTDTAGYDDTGSLGVLRIQKTHRRIDDADLALLVINSETGITHEDREFYKILAKRNIPTIAVFNKCDLCQSQGTDFFNKNKTECVSVSAINKTGIEELKKAIINKLNVFQQSVSLIDGLVSPCQTALLVIPIDSSAPKDRIILPQQQTIRAILDIHANAICVQPQEIPSVLASLKTPPAVVITDSQAFKQVSDLVPMEIPLTSFSIIFARHKGELGTLLKGINTLKTLTPESKILISEGCTHHRQCEDIGTVKIPAMLKKQLGFMPKLEFTSGGEFPADLTPYSLIIHCGGCMLNKAEMKSRIYHAEESGVPITNYGMFIANHNGILKRALTPMGITL